MTTSITSSATQTLISAGGNASALVLDSTGIVSGILLRSYLAGLTLSTAGASTTMSVAAGQASDSTNVVMMSLTAIAKTTSAWAVGTAAGGLDIGTIANATWYYFYIIRRPDTGVVDVIFSLSSSAPTLPTNYTQYRYIGGALTNGSAQWVAFTQFGDDFFWGTPVLDVAGTAGPTSGTTLTLTVPRGRKMKAILNANGGSGGQLLYLSDLSNSDLAPSTTAAPLANNSGFATAAGASFAGAVWTDTLARIRYRSSSTGAMYIATLGWTDLRDRNA